MIIFSLLFSFFGFLDAAYLTILHYKNIIPPCSLAHGCETVLTSKFAMIGPMPIAILGVLFYVVMMVLLGLLLQCKPTILSIDEKSRDHSTRLLFTQNNKKEIFIKKLLLLLASAGLAVSVFLVYLQAFVLHAFCQYCLASEGINVLLFIFILSPRLRRYV